MAMLLVLLLGACGSEERKPIRLTPTSAVSAGVRGIVDNCPGPQTIRLSVRENVLWEVESVAPVETTDTGVADAAPLTEPDPTTGALLEFLVGEAPPGYTETVPLAEPIVAGTRYTVSTEPDGQTVDFAVPDLSAGLVWDGSGNAQFNDDLIDEPCAEGADAGAFAQDVLILAALWVTTAALVLVCLISLLFVVTRRFSRVRSLEKKAARAQVEAEFQRPRSRSKS